MSSINNTSKVFEDFQINVKLKISALWVAVMFCYVYGDYIQLHVPGVLARAMKLNTTATDTNTQLELFAVALLMVIPSVMVFFTLVLKPKVNRWLNITLGISYIFLLVSVNVNESWAYYLFLTAMEIIISIIIVWYGWTWPKAEDSIVGNV